MNGFGTVAAFMINNTCVSLSGPWWALLWLRSILMCLPWYAETVHLCRHAQDQASTESMYYAWCFHGDCRLVSNHDMRSDHQLFLLNYDCIIGAFIPFNNTFDVWNIVVCEWKFSAGFRPSLHSLIPTTTNHVNCDIAVLCAVVAECQFCVVYVTITVQNFGFVSTHAWCVRTQEAASESSQNTLINQCPPMLVAYVVPSVTYISIQFCVQHCMIWRACRAM